MLDFVKLNTGKQAKACTDTAGLTRTIIETQKHLELLTPRKHTLMTRVYLHSFVANIQSEKNTHQIQSRQNDQNKKRFTFQTVLSSCR